MDFPGGAVVTNLPANAADAGNVGLISGLGRCPGEGNGHSLLYSSWEIHEKRSLVGYSSWGHKSGT